MPEPRDTILMRAVELVLDLRDETGLPLEKVGDAGGCGRPRWEPSERCSHQPGSRWRWTMSERPTAEHGFGEAFDALVEAGLLVEVPADEEYRAEWESETMWMWRWRSAPGKPEGEA